MYILGSTYTAGILSWKFWGQFIYQADLYTTIYYIYNIMSEIIKYLSEICKI